MDPNTAQLFQAIQAKAAAQGTTVAALLRPLAETGGGQKEQAFYETATTEEWLRAFRDWVSSHAGRDYGFVDDSRESIYTRTDNAL